MIKSFEKFNEGLINVIIDQSLNSNKTAEEEFHNDIRNHLVHIITTHQHISEKSFRQYDIVIAKTKEYFKDAEFMQKLQNLLGNFEKAVECRVEYWAERVFQEILNGEIINTDQTDVE